MSTENFYQDLPTIDHFADLSDSSVYHSLPDDWSVAVSDVKDSTGMIGKGKYKQVNLIGASTIMALLNLKKSYSIPFIFGGDGAAVCVPGEMVPQAKEALLSVKDMAAELYGIELRIGIVPVSFIRDSGYDVLVARNRLSPTHTQAAFSGGGLQFAEECLKDPSISERFSIDPAVVESKGDITGLECRWQNIPSAHEEIVSLIVQARGVTNDERNSVYREVLAMIDSIYGDETQCHPVQEQFLKMSLNERELMGESGIRSYRKGRMYRIRYWFMIRWNVLLGKYLMAFNVRTKYTEWGTYKQRLVRNTDFKKFDDKIRQVLSGSVKQRERLNAFLQKRYEEGALVFGIHVASSALVTCLLFDYSDAHIHLVDSDDGGYAAAALKMKEQLKVIDVQ
ncbi:MAG: DUF3095 domain-containing protein [Bacteroidetes bacterium]|nr:DUF3095 domain-containing protein [Bacteroidota bacterium]